MSEHQLAGARVMVVDDVPQSLRVVVDGLRAHDVVPVAFTDPRRAFGAAVANPPDAFVLDLAMPDLDGVELTRLLLAEPELRHAPIVFLTASDDPSDVQRAYEAGGSDYVTKPVRLAELVARLGVHVDRERQRQQLDLQNRLLHEAEELRDHVDAISRHDLRGPLSTIIGFSSALRTLDLPEHQRVDILDRIHAAGQRCMRQVERTLDLFRIENGFYDREPEEVDVLGLIGEITEDLRPTLASTGVALSTTPTSTGTSLARTDPHLLHSALSNLLDNAIDAASTTDGDVELSLDRRGERLVIRIDNAGAVPVDVRDRFFEKFATSGKASGTGLGTYSARTMLRATGGDVVLAQAGPTRTVVEVVVDRSPGASGDGDA